MRSSPARAVSVSEARRTRGDRSSGDSGEPCGRPHDEERAALIGMLTTEIESSKFPLSPRIEALKRIRAKLRGEDVSVQPAEYRNFTVMGGRRYRPLWH